MTHHSQTAETYLSGHGVRTKRRQGANGVEIVFDCPICGKKEKASINNTSYKWQCFSASCGAKGGDFLLFQAYGDAAPARSIRNAAGETLANVRREALDKAIKAATTSGYKAREWRGLVVNPTTEGARKAKAYIESRGLDPVVVSDALLGWTPIHPDAPDRIRAQCAEDMRRELETGEPTKRRPHAKDPTRGEGWITIPTFARWTSGVGDPSVVAVVKLRNICKHAKKSERYRRITAGASLLYAPYKLDPSRPLILVGGEFDALAALSLGLSNVASGVTGEGTLTDEQLEQLEPFGEIVLALDGDDAGRRGAAKMCKALGEHRTKIATLPDGVADWNDGLLSGRLTKELAESIVAAAEPPKIPELGHIADAAAEWLDRQYNPEVSTRGVSTGIEAIDELYGGGLRDGGVTIWTGDTGTGKSTITSQVALYRAEQGDPVVYLPLELGPREQFAKTLRQRLEANPALTPRSEVEFEIDRIRALPFWVVYFEDERTADVLVASLRAIVRITRARLVVVDHLQWLVPEGRDQAPKVQAFLRGLKRLAQSEDVHVIIVSHVKKREGSRTDRDSGIPQLGDLHGSSTIQKVADMVLTQAVDRDAARVGMGREDDGFCNASTVSLKARHDDAIEGARALRFCPDAATYYDLHVVEEFNRKNTQAIGVPTPQRKATT